MLGPKRKYFQTGTDKNSSEQLRKLEKIKPFGHSKAPKKKKLGQILLIFPILGKTTHMWFVVCGNTMSNILNMVTTYIQQNDIM